MLSVGSKLTFLKKLGKGGYGKVYKCTDERGREVAVKCIETDRREGIPCLMEASIMAKFVHPNIQSALHIHPLPLKLYIISEIALSDLSRYTRKVGLPSPAQLKNWTFQLIQAVGFLHHQNVRHGDIKAANVLLFPGDVVRLNDFTLASVKYEDSTITNKHTICTYTHRPLEVWFARDWDYPVDIWSLGCTLAEMALGFCPFPNQDDPQFVGSSEARELRIRERSIYCIMNWAEKGPEGPQELNYPRYVGECYPFVIDSLSTTQPELAPMIYSMLRVNPESRPKISELINDPLFASFERATLRILKINDSQLQQLTSREVNRLTQQLKEYTQSSAAITKSLELYHRCQNIRSIESHPKLMTCLWISGKLTHRTPIESNVPLHNILHYERIICSYLTFHL